MLHILIGTALYLNILHGFTFYFAWLFHFLLACLIYFIYSDKILTTMSSFEPFVEGWDFVETLGEGAYGE